MTLEERAIALEIRLEDLAGVPSDGRVRLDRASIIAAFRAVVEECAKVAAECEPSEQWPDGYGPVQTDIVAAIRART